MDSRVYYLSLAIVTLLYLLKSCVFSSKAGLWLPPGPWRLPVIGSLHHLIGALPHHALRDLSRRHGPLMFLKLGEIPVLVVSSAAAAKEVMKTHDVAVATRPLTATIEILTRQGEGVVMAPYGDHWRQLRKLCIVELLSTKRVQSFRRVREEEVSRLVRSVSSATQARQPVINLSERNLSERLTAYVTDATVRAILGDHFEDRDAFLRLVDDGVRIAGGFSLIDLFPSYRLVRLLSRTTVRRAVIYRQREDGLQIPIATGTIHALIFDLFGAGSETAATTLQWAMAELMKNPDVLSKAQAEVRAQFMDDMVSEEGLSKLLYLPLVIKETLRLHPPAPLLLPRECREQLQVLGYDVPMGTMVLVNAWAISTNEEYWEDAGVFRPERFESGTRDFKGNDFEFIPFGSGRRICPGMLFGLANIELALANLLFHFDWSLPEGVACGEMDMSETLEHLQPFGPPGA